MPRAPLLAELKALSYEELVERYDREAMCVQDVSLIFILEEIRYREQLGIAQSMERLTKWIMWLTVIILAATIVNIGIAVVLLFG